MPVEETAAKLKEEGKKLGGPAEEISRYLAEWVTDHPQDEAAVTGKEKTLGGCIQYLSRQYRKRAVQNMAMVRDDEVFKDVRAYYGLGSAHPAEVEKKAEPPAEEEKPKVYTAADETSLFGDDAPATNQKKENAAGPAPSSPAEKDIMSLSMDDFF